MSLTLGVDNVSKFNAYIYTQIPEANQNDQIKSPSWWPILSLAVWLLWWFASKGEKKYDTEYPYWEQVSLNNTFNSLKCHVYIHSPRRASSASVVATAMMIGYAVHPSEAPDVHDGICSTPVGKYSTPSEAPDLHDRICSTLDGKSNAPLHLLANATTCTQARLLMNMIGYAAHLIANAVHLSGAPDLWSLLSLQYTWWQMQYTWWLM